MHMYMYNFASYLIISFCVTVLELLSRYDLYFLSFFAFLFVPITDLFQCELAFFISYYSFEQYSRIVQVLHACKLYIIIIRLINIKLPCISSS